jgi:hypothetical protein
LIKKKGQKIVKNYRIFIKNEEIKESKKIKKDGIIILKRMSKCNKRDFIIKRF